MNLRFSRRVHVAEWVCQGSTTESFFSLCKVILHARLLFASGEGRVQIAGGKELRDCTTHSSKRPRQGVPI